MKRRTNNPPSKRHLRRQSCYVYKVSTNNGTWPRTPMKASRTSPASLPSCPAKSCKESRLAKAIAVPRRPSEQMPGRLGSGPISLMCRGIDSACPGGLSTRPLSICVCALHPVPARPPPTPHRPNARHVSAGIRSCGSRLPLKRPPDWPRSRAEIGSSCERADAPPNNTTSNNMGPRHARARHDTPTLPNGIEQKQKTTRRPGPLRMRQSRQSEHEHDVQDLTTFGTH